jgi:hypothetical protein
MTFRVRRLSRAFPPRSSGRQDAPSRRARWISDSVPNAAAADVGGPAEREVEQREELVAIVKTLSREEVVRLQNYLRKVFGTEALQVRTRERANDSAEIYLRGEFLGVVSKDTEDGDICYQVNMTILDLDLDEA